MSFYNVKEYLALSCMAVKATVVLLHVVLSHMLLFLVVYFLILCQNNFCILWHGFHITALIGINFFYYYKTTYIRLKEIIIGI